MNAEHVWFWYCKCQSVKEIEGCHNIRNSYDEERPCELSDIYRIVKRLKISSFLKRKHLRVMLKFGDLQTPPSKKFGDRRIEEILWEEAMNILSVPLKEKGII